MLAHSTLGGSADARSLDIAAAASTSVAMERSGTTGAAGGGDTAFRLQRTWRSRGSEIGAQSVRSLEDSTMDADFHPFDGASTLTSTRGISAESLTEESNWNSRLGEDHRGAEDSVSRSGPDPASNAVERWTWESRRGLSAGSTRRFGGLSPQLWGPERRARPVWQPGHLRHGRCFPSSRLFIGQ